MEGKVMRERNEKRKRVGSERGGKGKIQVEEKR